MGPSEARAFKAVNAMKDMGISEKRVKPILRNLLRLYDKNWELIEDENYRVLIDAIFEQENVGEDENKNSDVHVPDESSQPPLKRVRTRAQAEQVSSSSEVPLVKPKVEGGGSPITRRLRSREHGSTASQGHDKGKEGPSLSHSLSDCEEISPPHVRDRAVPARSSLGVCLKEPKVEPGITIQPKQSLRDARESSGLLKPKNEPMEVDPPFETPIAIISPSETQRAIREVPLQEDVCSTVNSFPGQINGSAEHLNGAELLVSKGKQDGISGAVCKTVTSTELANDGETPKSFEIASSPSGEVKISLNCNHPERSDFRIPSLDAVLKAVEDKCLRSYRILEPNFSMVNLMQEMCKSFLELSNKSPDPKEDTMIHLETDFNFLKNSNLQNAFGLNGGQQVNIQMPESSSVEVLNLPSASETPKVLLLADGDTIGEKDTEESDPIASSSRSLVVVPQYVAVDCVTPLHDVNDISKGEEKVRISLINELTSEPFPPKFYYIPRNIVYQNAYMNFSLARIGDEDCCSGCFGDCLSSSITCACARETGGEFAYTLEGLVKEKFLEECISLNRDPQEERHYHCKECPLERSKDGVSDSCKGHLVRKFIKECWSKCGCNMQCGNRVVQRGIRCNLQVFFTSEGKGWGLRTLEDLPKGSFVCEYVGEVLTNTELHERNMRSTGNEKHTYPVLLDADWGSEGVLKDEEALCLDATYFGNVARFINHRCYDGNMVEIPVEVETPDHHYYHLAFFTTRNVDALEELTWDYGIDFSDHTHPVKAFRCLCGSKCCRDMKRSHRTKSRR